MKGTHLLGAISNPSPYLMRDLVLNRAESFSRGQIENIFAVLTEPGLHGQLMKFGVGIAVSGSLGRLEALHASDVDLITLCPDETNPADILPLDQEIRARVRTALGVDVSRGENFTGPTRVADIAAPSLIGGHDDSVTLLTKRVAFITETRPVFNVELHASFREQVIAAFLASPPTRRRYLIPLIDEIVRYYRTLCVDYKSRVDSENKAWAIRYFKLRCARKYWFFSLALGITALLVRHEPAEDDLESALPIFLDATPTARLESAISLAGLGGHHALFSYYSRFIESISRSTVRDDLAVIQYDTRYQSELFVRMKQNTDRLHRAMLELIESLPAAWRRHLFSRFLLHS